VFIPSVLVGIPLGAYVIRRLDAETFRRICMSFDAWVVGFGLSRVLIELNLMESPWAYSVMAMTILIDAYLLYIFFTVQRGVEAVANTQRSADASLLSGSISSSEPPGFIFSRANSIRPFCTVVKGGAAAWSASRNAGRRRRGGCAA